MSSWGVGHLDVFVTGSDTGLWHKSYNNTAWSTTWEPLSGEFTSSLAAVSWGNGRIDVYGRGSDTGLWHKNYTNSVWSTWERLNGQLAANTAPTVSSWAAERLDVFVIGGDTALWQKSYA